MKVLHRLLAWIGMKPSDAREERSPGSIDFPTLEETLQYRISHRKLFEEALSHRSYLRHQGNESSTSNERLEFLGDAILNLVIGEFLFRQHPDAQEGTLTKLRSRLVNHKALSIYARHNRLSQFVLMSPSAAQMEGKGMDTILSDAFEALLGAMYLDSGFEQVRQFIERNVRSALKRGILHVEDKNFKSQLLEMSQSEGLGTPRYTVIEQEGPDHDRTFTIEVFLGTTSYGMGVGKNKKDAEQAAAENAVLQLQTELHSDTAGDQTSQPLST